MASNTISIAISADDQASRVIAKVDKGFQDFSRRVVETGAGTERFTSGLKKLDDGGGINRVATGLGDVRRSITGAAESLGRFAPALAGLASAGTVAGIAGLVEKWTSFGSRLGADSRRIGMSADNLHYLQNAARLAGSSAEALTGGMQTLGDNLVNAVAGRSPMTVNMLSTLGIAFRDAKTGGTRLAEDVLPEIVQQLAKVENPTRRALIATTLFGGAGEALIPLLDRMARGTAATREEMERYGLMNAEGVRASEALRAAQQRLGFAAEGVGYSIAKSLAPVLVPLLERLSLWVADHREDIAAFFERVARGLQGWVDNGGLADMLTRLDRLGTVVGIAARGVDTVVTALGGWQLAAEVLLTFMAGRWAMGMVASVGRVTGALNEMKSAMPGPGAAGGVPLGRGGSLIRTMGTGSMLGIGMDMLEGSTPEQQHAMNVDSLGARIGKAIGDVLGMKFDSEGHSEGLLSRWFGAGESQRAARNYATATPAENRWAKLPIAGSRRNAHNFDASLSPEARGLLDTIAGTESPGYDVMYGGRRFTDMSHHPDVAFPIRSGPNAGRTSSAAGRYQFLKSTWDEAAAATDAEDFKPASQDRAAWWLAQRDYNARTGRDLATDLKSRDMGIRAGIGRALHDTWTSLPGGIEAGTNDDRFSRQLDAAIQRNRVEAAAPPPLAPPVPLPPAPVAGQAGANGRVAVDINFQNQPPGLRMTTSTEGGVTVRAPRIETAMPSLALP